MSRVAGIPEAQQPASNGPCRDCRRSCKSLSFGAITGSQLPANIGLSKLITSYASKSSIGTAPPAYQTSVLTEYASFRWNHRTLWTCAYTLSCALQCDVWRPLRLPGVLVGDGRLGGISSTIAARECLLLRGYDLAAIVLMDDGLANWKYLREHFGNRVPVVPLPPCRPPPHTGCDSLYSDLLMRVSFSCAL